MCGLTPAPAPANNAPIIYGDPEPELLSPSSVGDPVSVPAPCPCTTPPGASVSVPVSLGLSLAPQIGPVPRSRSLRWWRGGARLLLLKEICVVVTCIYLSVMFSLFQALASCKLLEFCLNLQILQLPLFVWPSLLFPPPRPGPPLPLPPPPPLSLSLAPALFPPVSWPIPPNDFPSSVPFRFVILLYKLRMAGQWHGSGMPLHLICRSPFLLFLLGLLERLFRLFCAYYRIESRPAYYAPSPMAH